LLAQTSKPARAGEPALQAIGARPGTWVMRESRPSRSSRSGRHGRAARSRSGAESPALRVTTFEASSGPTGEPFPGNAGTSRASMRRAPRLCRQARPRQSTLSAPRAFALAPSAGAPAGSALRKPSLISLRLAAKLVDPRLEGRAPRIEREQPAEVERDILGADRAWRRCRDCRG
jgi:hypothetical protein